MKVINVILWVLVLLGAMYFLFSIGFEKAKVRELEEKSEQNEIEKTQLEKAAQKEKHLRLTIYQAFKDRGVVIDSISQVNVEIRRDRNKDIMKTVSSIRSRDTISGSNIYQTWIEVYNQHKNDLDMEEIWKDIPGYEGLYQASSTGKISTEFPGKL